MIKVLDVTLRDGGCVNNFGFGQVYMERILHALESARVDVIELGYLDEKDGSLRDRTQFSSEQAIRQNFLTQKVPGRQYVAMVDFGKFDVRKLRPRQEGDIDGIRMAFHKKDWQEALSLGRVILERGYQLYIQPMLTLRYSDMELLELIQAVNQQLPQAEGFYIVDSFGEMRGTDVTRLMQIVDHNLKPEITLGLHSHNNLQLSYANAMALLAYPTRRNRILDASVMGMGKGAGNLNTELLLEHMNLYHDGHYRIAPLLELIDQVIRVIHQEHYWGYAAEYYLSAVHHCSPSYASHFYNRHMLSMDQVAQLLESIPEEKKISFDKELAESMYLAYNRKRKLNDEAVLEKLRKVVSGRSVLLVAPGKSIAREKEKIHDMLFSPEVVSVGLNQFVFDTDFVLTTRPEVYRQALERGCRVIAPSNVGSADDGAAVIDYEKWIVDGEKTQDSSGVMGLMLAKSLGASQILLAGFDGFSGDVNENYWEASMRKPISSEEAQERNAFYAQLIARISDAVPVRFLTKSRYQNR